MLVWIISKDYKNGTFYLRKGTIIETRDSNIVIMTPDGNLLEDIKEKMIETTIPNIKMPIKVVKGVNAGK